MTPDQERWAEALQIEQMLGDFGPLWIAERIGYLGSVGDEAGVARFREIARRYEQLIASPKPQGG